VLSLFIAVSLCVSGFKASLLTFLAAK